MGWSCAAKAGDVLRAWERHCLAETNTTNVFTTSKGRYFFEVSRAEHRDGAITGTIWKETHREGGKMFVKRSGSFRINGDGAIERAPKVLKEAV